MVYIQARAGFELQVSRRWAYFGEAKFFWAGKKIRITADDKEQFGTATPSITMSREINGFLNPNAFPYGGRPAYVILGGLQQKGKDPFTGAERDYFLGYNSQPGEYYMNGGELKYGGWVFTTGLRFTL